MVYVKFGDIVTYQNWNELKRGRIVGEIGKKQLHVVKLDGPLAGGIAWIHRESVVSVESKESE